MAEKVGRLFLRAAAVGIHRFVVGVKRVVPWGVLGLEGLLRACCARWWATSDMGSHKARERSPGGQRKEKPGEWRQTLGIWRKNRNRTCEWEARNQEGRGYKVGMKKEAPEKQTMGLEHRGGGWCTTWFHFKTKTLNPTLVHSVAQTYCINDLCASMPPRKLKSGP